MPVEFRQHDELGNGRTRTIKIARPADIERKAYSVRTAGGQFLAQVLPGTGEVSISCERDDNLLAIEVVPNNASVPDAVDKVVNKAHRHLAREVRAGKGET